MTPQARRLWERAGAIALGLALASLPFVHFGVGAGHSHAKAPHADHESYHGGVVRMVGDHHLELVAAPDRILVFVSDARRRPLRAASAVALFDGAARSMRWQADHFSATPDGLGDRDEADYGSVAVDVTLESGVVLRAAATRSSLLEMARSTKSDGTATSCRQLRVLMSQRR